MAPFSVIVDQAGDKAVVIQDFSFSVSSHCMSATSPVFQELFSTHKKTVKLQGEDPGVFRLIFQSAHAHFIPTCDVTTDALVGLADAIRRYKIYTSSSIHTLVRNHFDARTRQPGYLSTSDLISLLQVAKVLGSTDFIELLENMFHFRSLSFMTLPIEQLEPGCSDCAPLLGSYSLHEFDKLLLNLKAELISRGQACRASVAKILSPHETYDVTKWILEQSPSLYDIDLRLRGMQCSKAQIQDARNAIATATMEASRHFHNTIMEDGKEASLRPSPIAKRLQIQSELNRHCRHLVAQSSKISTTTLGPWTKSTITVFNSTMTISP
jgi:hypothetical protein